MVDLTLLIYDLLLKSNLIVSGMTGLRVGSPHG